MSADMTAMAGGAQLVRGVPGPVAIEMLRVMILSRALEDRLHRLFQQGRLRGRLISGRGQEAIPVGAAMALVPDDVVCPVHRDLGVHLVRGTTLSALLGHYFGRVTGPSRGRDGDIHVGEWSRHVFPMVSHLPDSWPVAVGMGLGAKLMGLRRVVLAFAGDGASSAGAWHEALNFAAVFSTPNVFVVENNQFAYSTPTHRQFRIERLALRAPAYGMPGRTVNGNDALEVYAATREAVEHARRGDGPFLLEALTMRMDGHAAHDGADYVPRELLDAWKDRDPIDRLEAELVRSGLVTATVVNGMRNDAASVVTNAVAEAEQAPWPDPTELELGVYAPA